MQIEVTYRTGVCLFMSVLNVWVASIALLNNKYYLMLSLNNTKLIIGGSIFSYCLTQVNNLSN